MASDSDIDSLRSRVEQLEKTFAQMKKNQIDRLDDMKRRTADQQLQLVWRRYSAMIVAHSILLGFTASLASSTALEREKIGIAACLFGLVLSVLWLHITSAGWSIAHAWISGGNEELKELYQGWLSKVRGKFDPIWLTAHTVIVVFYFAYVSLAWMFGRQMGLEYPYLILASAVALLTFWLLFERFRARFDPSIS